MTFCARPKQLRQHTLHRSSTAVSNVSSIEERLSFYWRSRKCA